MCVNAIITLGPLACACYFANIGSLLAYTGAISGFFAIYLLPVLVHLKRRYTQITNPLLAEAVALNEFQVLKSEELKSPKANSGGRLADDDGEQFMSKSPKIMISDRIAQGKKVPSNND